MSFFQKLSITYKVTLLTIFFILAVITILLIFANPIANRILVNKLNSTLAGKYEIKTKQAKIDFFSSDLVIEKISVSQFSNKNAHDSAKVLDFFAERIVIKDLGLFSYLFSKRIKCDSIAVFQPNITIFQNKNDTTRAKQKSLVISGLKLRKFSIVNGRFIKYDEQKKDSLIYVNAINFNLHNFMLPKDSALSLKNIHFDNVELSSSRINFSKNDALYAYSVDSVNISTAKQRVDIHKFRLIPRYSKYEFAKFAGKQIARMDFRVSEINLNHINLETFLQRDSLFAGKLLINDFVLNVFKDNRVQRPKNLPNQPFPQEIIRELDLPLKVDSIICSSGYMAFEVRTPGSSRSGNMFISKGNLSVFDISNIPNSKGFIKDMKIFFSGNLMGAGKLNAQFNLPLHDLRKPMTYSGSVSKMDLRKFNAFLEPSLFMKIKSGNLNKLTFNVIADKSHSQGELAINYNNLNLTVQKLQNREILENSRMEWLVNLLVNSFLIKSENPVRNRDLRVGTINFERDKTRFVTHYWIQSILSGLPEALGVPPKIVKKQAAKKAD